VRWIAYELRSVRHNTVCDVKKNRMLQLLLMLNLVGLLCSRILPSSQQHTRRGTGNTSRRSSMKPKHRSRWLAASRRSRRTTVRRRIDVLVSAHVYMCVIPVTTTGTFQCYAMQAEYVGYTCDMLFSLQASILWVTLNVCVIPVSFTNIDVRLLAVYTSYLRVWVRTRHTPPCLSHASVSYTYCGDDHA
jgi:hypothetical protein